MTKSTITREESVQAVFDLKAGYRLGFADIEILKRVARMALAAMDGEPVVFTDERNLHHIAMGRETSLIWGKQNSETGDVPLYRHAQQPVDSEPVGYLFHNEYGAVLYSISDDATEGFSLIGPIYSVPQPAQVVPEEATPDSIEILASARRRDHAVFQWDEDQRNAAADSWNAFRAAMLQELKKVQELKRSAGVTKMCRCCTPNLRRNPIAARRKTTFLRSKTATLQRKSRDGFR
ncbi:hypothetical protein [Klebsiella pneumoniae]|uniref:hypothetical protein n=1 Tax=Klebsiella pneumoniae TaxID=573 RepID=UPI003896E2B7